MPSTFGLVRPQTRYHETIRSPTDVDYTHKKQASGTAQFARVKLRLEPNETGKGNVCTYYELDSSKSAFEIAARPAMREGCRGRTCRCWSRLWMSRW
jgi:translation elongation factor EF-G